jgi:O-antigen/teichoic acid export membrane protein
MLRISCFRVLLNIDEATVDEIYAKVRQIAQIYAAFLVINIVQVATTDEKTDRDLFVWAVVGMGLYLLNVLALFYMVKQPKEKRIPFHMILPLVTNPTLAAFKISNMVFLIQYGAFLWILICWSLFSVISALLQMMTCYVLWKLRDKMLFAGLRSEIPEETAQDLA